MKTNVRYKHLKISKIMIIYGKHPILCALNSNCEVEKVLIYNNLRDKERIINICKSRNIDFELVSKSRIKQLVGDEIHQGICAYLKGNLISKLSDNLNDFIKNNSRILLILERIQDPHNVGSIVRTAQILNVKNIISTYSKSSKITPSVVKASAGSIFYVKFSFSDNVKRVIEILKNNGISVYVLERNGYIIDDFDIKSEKLALIVGSEHYGVRKYLIEMSDAILSLRQINEQVNSYNVSNAVSIALYLLTLKFGILWKKNLRNL